MATSASRAIRPSSVQARLTIGFFLNRLLKIFSTRTATPSSPQNTASRVLSFCNEEARELYRCLSRWLSGTNHGDVEEGVEGEGDDANVRLTPVADVHDAIERCYCVATDQTLAVGRKQLGQLVCTK